MEATMHSVIVDDLARTSVAAGEAEVWAEDERHC